MFKPTALLSTATLMAFFFFYTPDALAQQAKLEKVATFDHQVTGVGVAKDGRTFVNFPRWNEDVPYSVAEVMKDGSVKPYPNADWNSWRNEKSNELSAVDHFVCVQSVVPDKHGNLWVLDPAAPATQKIVKGGPKLVKIDLASNSVTKVIPFDETVAPVGSYLNDVRFSSDGKFAYMADSGKGALVVLDLTTGKARRVLDGHASTMPEKDVKVKTDGKVLRMPDGRGVEFAADGIALSADDKYLYWQALTGKTLYRLPTSVLNDPSALNIEGSVETVRENGPSDGLWIDGKDRMYVSAIQENAIKRFDGEKMTMLVTDKRLRWPDTFSEGPDGAIYVTTSRIMDSAMYKDGADRSLETNLWKISKP